MAQTSVLTTTRTINRGMKKQGMIIESVLQSVHVPPFVSPFSQNIYFFYLKFSCFIADAVVLLSQSISWRSPARATRYEDCSTQWFTAPEARSMSPLSSQTYWLTSRGETQGTWTPGSGTTPAQNIPNMMINITIYPNLFNI